MLGFVYNVLESLLKGKFKLSFSYLLMIFFENKNFVLYENMFGSLFEFKNKLMFNFVVVGSLVFGKIVFEKLNGVIVKLI